MCSATRRSPAAGTAPPAWCGSGARRSSPDCVEARPRVDGGHELGAGELGADLLAHRPHVAVEASEASFARREALQGPAGAERLLDLRDEIDPERASGRGGPRASSHTTAISTADAQGAVVSMLISVFDDFGAVVLVPEGGFLLNPRLLGFTRSPNHPRPGGVPVSTDAPT